MNFNDAEGIITKFKSRPIRTGFVVLVLMLLVAGIAYFSGFFEAKGKQHALSSVSIGQPTVAAAGNAVQRNNTDRDGVTINQRTQGDRSPAVVSRGNVTIQYDTPKDRDKKE